MDDLFAAPEEAVPEHSLAALHGLAALVVGTFAWSGAAALFGGWSLLAAPGLGWLVAWACRYGARRMSAGVRAIAWSLSIGSALAGLAALATFSVLQASPDAGLDGRGVAEAAWSLFAAPPWFGSFVVLLVMPGTSRALRGEEPVAGSRTGAVIPLPATASLGRRRVPDPGVAPPGTQVEPSRVRAA
jgi:hypothetical protein